MKVLVEKASDWEYHKIKKFKSYKELFEWMKKTYYSFIIKFCTKDCWKKKDIGEHDFEIEIYDYYVE
jgi:hypothetical protein